ncbi:hypothetical protein F4677DRAFT_26926 [Hypoxylon crocopeplum]|nr:hypothetical protein F4677DRAFT_26926 [Hypoxylon crocopeplum]
MSSNELYVLVKMAAKPGKICICCPLCTTWYNKSGNLQNHLAKIHPGWQRMLGLDLTRGPEPSDMDIGLMSQIPSSPALSRLQSHDRVLSHSPGNPSQLNLNQTHPTHNHYTTPQGAGYGAPFQPQPQQFVPPPQHRFSPPTFYATRAADPTNHAMTSPFNNPTTQTFDSGHTPISSPPTTVYNPYEFPYHPPGRRR